MQLEETLDRDARFRGRARHLDADAGLLVEPLLATAKVLAPAERRKELRGRAGERNARTDEPQPRVAHQARRGAAQPGVRRTDRASVGKALREKMRRRAFAPQTVQIAHVPPQLAELLEHRGTNVALAVRRAEDVEIVAAGRAIAKERHPARGNPREPRHLAEQRQEADEALAL